MLYISRCFDQDHVGVVDTDDGVEEKVSITELAENLYESDIKIYGIEHIEFSNGACNTKMFPYQFPNKETSRQTKLRAMTGIRTVIYNGVLVGISMAGVELRKPLKIRLSDLAPECGKCILDWSVEDDYNGAKLTLVIDDKLKFGDDTFCSPVDGTGFNQDVHGIVFDLREWSTDDEDLLLSVYLDIDVSCGYAKRAIIDNKARKEHMLDVLEDV